MKKVFFVSAIMCMAAVAFVACKKDSNDPSNPGGGSGSGKCTCYALGQDLGVFDLGGLSSCSALATATMEYMGGATTVTCNPY